MQRKWDADRQAICASNRNKVLTDFIRTGTYDKNRDFYTTISPSMDILISSNLERLLFDLYDEDDAAVRALYASLAEHRQLYGERRGKGKASIALLGRLL